MIMGRQMKVAKRRKSANGALFAALAALLFAGAAFGSAEDTGGLSPGAHVFMLEIGYWRQDEKGKGCEYITDSQPFYVLLT